MTNDSIKQGFSKLNRIEKIWWLMQQTDIDKSAVSFLDSFEIEDIKIQSLISDLSENQISNYHLPYSLAPNFLVDGTPLIFPLVTEESSVVAAMAKAAGFWARRGGFHTRVIGTEKKGQVHFLWNGDPNKLKKIFPFKKKQLHAELEPLTQNMEKRGGGINKINLSYLPEIKPGYYQLDVSFETSDAMGANFINTCLEQIGKSFKNIINTNSHFTEKEQDIEIIMAILSNYVPNSSVKVWVECPITELAENNFHAQAFAEKFVLAVHIARKNVSRAVTHNKGILNGVDALAVATGNDYRAIEAGAHAFAAQEGSYKGLSNARIENNRFHFEMEIPLAVGVVGGVTVLHPLAKFSMQILKNPSAKKLMGYLAVAGLASNWSALSALVSGGIQKGHMKMHLSNIMNRFNLSENQKKAAQDFFEDRDISFSEVQKYFAKNEKS